VVGADEFFQVGEHAREQRAEVGGAMVRAIGGHRRLRGGEKGRWAGSEESIFLEHLESRRNRIFDGAPLREGKSEFRSQNVEVKTSFASVPDWRSHFCILTSYF